MCESSCLSLSYVNMLHATTGITMSRRRWSHLHSQQPMLPVVRVGIDHHLALLSCPRLALLPALLFLLPWWADLASRS